MNLEQLGFNEKIRKSIQEQNLESFDLGRIIAEHKERYILKTAKEEIDAEITGNMRYTAKSREDYPAVGDWVAATVYDTGIAIIHKLLPRYSLIKRQAAGKPGEIQVIAANIDFAFIVQSVDRDFNINRLERYLTICNSSKVIPIIILTKTDLADKNRIAEISDKVATRIKNIPVIAISNETKEGYEEINNIIKKGKTYCMLGSSGAGKSTLLNNLSGRPVMKTDIISFKTHKGRHTTSHRELIILEKGGILIDNPGMREVGITDTEDGLETTFTEIVSLAKDCKFKNCTHTNEKGCAILEALENGEIDINSYRNFMKMEKEKAHFESTIAERRKKEKIFGKILKDYHKKDPKQRR